MRASLKTDVAAYIEAHIPEFHAKRLERLQRLDFNDVLRRKNPYLFRAKNLVTAEQLVRSLLDAYLSAQEETLFGSILEGLALFVGERVFGAYKSSAEGIDMELDKEGTHYLVTIKSGPHWGNSSQIKRMLENFRQARRILSTSSVRKPVVAVNGCCYGRDVHAQKNEYLKLCGQSFWYFISGEDRLYLDIIEPLGHKAREHNERFAQRYAEAINRYARDFANAFCTPTGQIDWEKIVRMNSSAEEPRS